jgi:DNA-binding NarL/FixJ family response regulator
MPEISPAVAARRTSPIRVVLADDSETFLDVLCRWLARDEKYEIAALAHDGHEALEAVERLRPDLVLIDAVMPLCDGFQATRRIKESAQAPVVIIVTLHDSDVARDWAETAGADGFVSKSELSSELPRLLRTLYGES